ncbi:hypothetical protein ACFQ3Z_41780 [Streptomyces nogalater]
MYIRTLARTRGSWEALDVLGGPADGPVAFGGDLGPQSSSPPTGAACTPSRRRRPNSGSSTS